MEKRYTIIVKEWGKIEGEDCSNYVYQKEIKLEELKYLLSTVRARKLK